METISSFVRMNKAWYLRKAIADYARAKNMFYHYDRNYLAGRDVTFDHLKKLSELLFVIKEDFHLIFKRVIDPKARKFEDSMRSTPTILEIEWINNVGLLFHKTLVTREIKYVMQQYATDSEDYAEMQVSFDSYWGKLKKLFNEGTEILRTLLVDYSTNDIVLSYLFENDDYIQDTLAVDIKSLLQESGQRSLDDAYVRAGDYCLKSGWTDRARRLLHEALRVNCENEQAKILSHELNSGH
ncbi:hypothetical protein GF406_15500 [candidate division KSB1 bacterium]|jgi:uncharacterized membrane-anchored protein YhcB (DUF1043 family)|nr:hypothetical protein [candidate division KSB1 bacterium]